MELFTGQRQWLKAILEPLAPTFREVLAMSLFVNVLAMAAPVFTLQVYDRVVSHAGISTLWGLFIGMVIVFTFDYILRQARSRIMQTIALRVDVIVGKRVFHQLMSLPLANLESQPAAFWQTLFRDVDVVRNTLSGAAAILICDLPFIVFFLGLVFVIAMPVVWVLLIVFPAFVVIAWRSAGVLSEANRAERNSGLSRDGLIAEIIAARSTIKALGMDRALRPLWEEKHADAIEKSILRGSKADGYANMGAILSSMTSVLLTTAGAVAIISQELTMGALIATNMLSGRLLGPLNQLVGTWKLYATFKQSVERLGKMFSMPVEREAPTITLERPKGEVTMEGITFRYGPDRPPVLNDLKLTIMPGGITAIVGRNGSGKTTLVKLLQGLYRPTKGRIMLDGADIAQFTRGELANWIGYVPQDCVLFSGSIRDNIAYRLPTATDEEILEASNRAGVHPFIIDMPDGYATDIGEAGVRLSGGQRQRIAIARALAGDPAVLLLDEPSSSLDRQAEEDLRDTLIELAKTHTIIVVTHSPILLQACHNLVALDRGRIALAGPTRDVLPRLFGRPAPAEAKHEATTGAVRSLIDRRTPERIDRRASDRIEPQAASSKATPAAGLQAAAAATAPKPPSGAAQIVPPAAPPPAAPPAAAQVAPPITPPKSAGGQS